MYEYSPIFRSGVVTIGPIYPFGRCLGLTKSPTQKVCKIVREALRHGSTVAACTAAWISEGAFYRWKKQDQDFQRAVETGRRRWKSHRRREDSRARRLLPRPGR